MGMAKMPDVVNGYNWELYNIADDYSEANDLAAKMPDKLRDMQELFLVEAAKYEVLPLDNDVLQRALSSASERGRRQDRLYLLGGSLRHAGKQRPQHPRQVLHDHGRGGDPSGRRRRDAQHASAAHSAATASTWSRASRSSPTCNSRRNAPAGKARRARARQAHHRVRLQDTTERGFGKGGTGVLSVDGKEVDTKKMPYTHSVHSLHRRVLRRRGRHPLRGGRQRLPPALPVHRQADKLTIRLVPPERTAEEEDLLRKKKQEVINAGQ